MDLDGYVIIFAQTTDHKLKLFGCPADQANVEATDEIVEVNGRSVKNCPREFLTKYVKQCIKSRTVSLRVKRRKKHKNKASTIEKVHDAYVIAVEDDARKKIDQFTTGQQVHAVDMTQIPTATAANSTSSSLSRINIEGSPAKVGQESSTVKVGKNKQQSTQDKEAYHFPDSSVYQPVSSSVAQTESISMPGEKKSTNQVPTSKGDFTINGDTRDNNGEWVEMNGIEDKDGRKQGRGKLGNRSSASPAAPLIDNFLSNGAVNMSSKNNNSGSHHGGYSNGGHHSYDLSMDSSFDHDIYDQGPHREMAIDVPENFIASVKSPPRYPPPQSSSGMSLSIISPSKTNHREHKHEKSHSQTSFNTPDNTPKQKQPTPQELERLHKHEQELKKRREEESRLHAEQEFLRASLRGSKKLQALENSRPVAVTPTGFVNTAFDNEGDDEDDDIDGLGSKSHSRSMSDDMLEEPYLKKNVGVEDIFSSLHHIRNRLPGPEDQKYISFLRSLFQNEHFQQAVSLHNQLVELTSRSPPVKPITDDAEQLHAEVHHFATQSGHSVQAKELVSLLNKPQLKNLLEAHDTISQHALQPSDEMDFQGELGDYPLVQYGENSVKIIHLEKTNEHLGATVKNEGESVIIGRIVKGGAAEKSGLLHEGDEILEVNGIDMRGRNINDVSEMLANMSGTITFIIIPGSHSSSDNVQRSNKVMHLRALFSYEPEDDPYIPCRELGINFMKGDILHAIALDDPNWWQAFREGEEEDQSLAGLIPSKSFTEQREAMKNMMENKENKRKNRVCACGRKDRKKRKKKKTLPNGSSEDSEEILTYEEIARYYPQPNRKRPIVLVGPSNVGRNELQQKLLDSDPDRFGTPVPHTTLPLQGNEIQGSTYHHIPREEFNMMIQQNRFVEFGDHQKNLYGTSFDAIRDVIAQGKVCLLKIQPETLKVIRAADLKPYIIFVCPPTLDKLRLLQDQLDSPLIDGVKKGKDVQTIDDQLRDIIDRSREIEELYGHLFDFVLVNSELVVAYTELLEEINRIEMEPQWVPAVWIGS